MTPPSRWIALKRLLREELNHLTTIHPSDRLWHMPLAAALASGLPLLIGAHFDRLGQALLASIGGLVFLYLPPTPMHHRMVLLMACAFGMSASYTVGALSQFVPGLMTPALVVTTLLVTMICRYYALGPPGSLFFVMAAAIGAFSPAELSQVPLRVGLVTLGCLLACLIAFVYSLYTLRLRAPQPVAPLPPATFDFVVFDSVLIAAFVGIALVLAQALRLPNAYWVLVSCLAVIQGVSLRAVWNRQLQRTLGTGVGLLVAWALLSLPLDAWGIALLVMMLSFVIETTVVRHYAFATIFITPLTILLAESATLGRIPREVVIEARFLDTVLGCLVGLAGGICLHSPRFRQRVARHLKRLVPVRLSR